MFPLDARFQYHIRPSSVDYKNWMTTFFGRSSYLSFLCYFSCFLELAFYVLHVQHLYSTALNDSRTFSYLCYTPFSIVVFFKLVFLNPLTQRGSRHLEIGSIGSSSPQVFNTDSYQPSTQHPTTVDSYLPDTTNSRPSLLLSVINDFGSYLPDTSNSGPSLPLAL